MKTLTLLLREWRAGDREAAESLMAMIYDELYRLAGRYLRGERAGHTFRPTDLVSEAYLRLASASQPEWNDRIHFFAIASRKMREILVDHARKRRADKRGGGVAAAPFDDSVIGVERPVELLALDDALAELERVDERKARAIELHYFGGLTHDEVAEVLEVHPNTVARDLRFAEAWIHTQIRGDS